MQGGLNWELIALVAGGASAALIAWDAAIRKGPLSDTMKGILEIAWPVLFIALMGLLLKFTDFAAVLLLAGVVTGIIWLVDARVLAPRRGQEAAEPIVVDMARAFFPVIVVVFVIRSFWVEPFKIPSGSMKPTLLVGDFILVNKYTYGIRLPVLNRKVMEVGEVKRGDVVVFRYPVDPSVDYIKRVVGLPGDKVTYAGKALMINGQQVPVQASGFYTDGELNYLRLPTFSEKLGERTHTMMVVPPEPPVNLSQVRQFPHRENCEYNDGGFSCTVPPGHYFMMGDNRDQSADSRYWGFVPDDHVKGRAFLVWMNFGDFKRIGNEIARTKRSDLSRTLTRPPGRSTTPTESPGSNRRSEARRYSPGPPPSRPTCMRNRPRSSNTRGKAPSKTQMRLLESSRTAIGGIWSSFPAGNWRVATRIDCSTHAG